MRVTEALLRQNNQKKKKIPAAEEKEETQRYQEQELERWDLNQTKSIFASPFGDGLNTGESIFDRQAVFRTERK